MVKGGDRIAATGDGDEAMASQYVHQAKGWFDSVWNTVAREYSL